MRATTTIQATNNYHNLFIQSIIWDINTLPTIITATTTHNIPTKSYIFLILQPGATNYLISVSPLL